MTFHPEHLHARVRELEARVHARRAAIASARRQRPHWVFFAPLLVALAGGFALAFRAPPATTSHLAAMRDANRVSTEAASTRCEETKAGLEGRTDACSRMVEDLAGAP